MSVNRGGGVTLIFILVCRFCLFEFYGISTLVDYLKLLLLLII